MKTALAMVCSLMLAGMQVVFAHPAPACAAPAVRACCACGGKMSCCAARPAPNSPATPANPARVNAPNDFSLFAPATLVSTLPDTAALSPFTPATSLLSAKDAPLYARHCARLI